MRIGILALQGNFCQHKKILDILGIQNIMIRHASDLEKCNSLIIPGGESTTISKQIDNNQFRKILCDFSLSYPILGTCAGMIMLSMTEPTKNMIPLNLMDFEVERNSWGRQIDSFSANINLNFDVDRSFHGTFIRAPKVRRIGKDIQVLSTYNNVPVLLRNGMHIASSFHPEIGNDFRIHEYLINQINAKIPALI